MCVDTISVVKTLWIIIHFKFRQKTMPSIEFVAYNYAHYITMPMWYSIYDVICMWSKPIYDLHSSAQCKFLSIAYVKSHIWTCHAHACTSYTHVFLCAYLMLLLNFQSFTNFGFWKLSFETFSEPHSVTQWLIICIPEFNLLIMNNLKLY